jgi:hypothetical protein
MHKSKSMKKLFTFCFAVASFFAAQAQTQKEDARRVILKGGGQQPSGNGSQSPRDVILGGGSNGETYPGGTSREARIDAINREYDAKIASIRNNPSLSAEEKERAIRQLERDRQRKIRQVTDDYRDRRDDRDDDRDEYKKEKRNGNNGKHKGWYKGKGNQKEKNKAKHQGRNEG